MSIGILFFAGGHLLATAVFTLIGLIAVWNQKRALNRAIVAKMTKYTAIEAYQRFVPDRTRISLTMRKICVIILCIALPSDFLLSAIFPTICILLPIICISYYMGMYINNLIRAAVVDVEALHAFQISSLSRDTILKLKLRSVVFALPMLCYLEALALILLLNHNVLPESVLLLFPFLVVILLVIRNFFALRLYRLATPLQPIEQTQWASLVPRIQRWARLAGIEFASIQLQQDLIGTSIVGIIGLGRPTLILSETLLRYTDWLQQDAIIGLAIGLAQKRMFLTNFVRSLLLIIAFFAFIALFPFITSLVGLVGSGTTILCIVLVVSILLRVAGIIARRHLRSAYFDVDRIAALLTGDPIAVMVALNTINALNGVSAAKRRSRLVPSTYERMQQLEVILHQPWPRAAHATMPVPSIMAIGLGEHYLTMPLDQATEAAPLPAMPYASPA